MGVVVVDEDEDVDWTFVPLEANLVVAAAGSHVTTGLLGEYGFARTRQPRASHRQCGDRSIFSSY